MPVWRHRGILSLVLALFTAGLMAGGSLSATVAWSLAGLIGWLPQEARAAALLLIGTAVVLQEAGFLHLKLPANHRQVPQEIFSRGPYRSALHFGFELGTGVRTYLPSAVPYLLLAALLLLQAPLGSALLAGAAFGIGRATMTLSRTASPDSGTWDALLQRRLKVIQPVSGVAGMLAVCGTLIW